ncbi:MAG TPA: hypothetical protein VIC51_14970, partial [Psychromonas sp.]
MDKPTSSQQVPMNALIKSMLSSAYKLSLFVLISIVLLLTVRYFTSPVIALAEKQTLLNTFNQVLPIDLYDNEPLTDTLQLLTPKNLALLGTENPVTFYRARKNKQPAGL